MCDLRKIRGEIVVALAPAEVSSRWWATANSRHMAGLAAVYVGQGGYMTKVAHDASPPERRAGR